jgi:hypothetical protein
MPQLLSRDLYMRSLRTVNEIVSLFRDVAHVAKNLCSLAIAFLTSCRDRPLVIYSDRIIDFFSSHSWIDGGLRRVSGRTSSMNVFDVVPTDGTSQHASSDISSLDVPDIDVSFRRSTTKIAYPQNLASGRRKNEGSQRDYLCSRVLKVSLTSNSAPSGSIF